MVRFPAVAHFNFLDFPENFKNCFRLHRKRRNPGCSLAVEYLYIYIYIQSKNLRYKLLYTLLKLLYNTTTTIPRGAKYNDNPEALKKEKLKRKTFKRKPDIIIK